ncbi:translation initiation factor eIF-2B subunit epsilon-like [Anneissia japonica]|uniref:translation initiation factor eIF-2B subunit epsilon-like n=1 Tax=Anneissia japonica TaxID=1529436 RepID=UPI0014258167|nr:translation initiation factor eIF-2B subunit epsilon-like [Anneissia japonica]
MSSKKKGSKAADPLLKQEDVLQAVVLADSFNVRFAPITKEIPRVLMPIVNNPLLDYTIEFLAAAGVEEIFVFCCAHADKIKKHLSESKWNKRTSPCTVTTIMSEGCHSLGDAMREIDRKALIRSDFILVNGDVVSSVQLKDALNAHRERLKVDKSCVMTKVLRHAYPGHRGRCTEDEFFVATDNNGTILNYQKMKHVKKVKIPVTLFKEHSNVSLRYDLQECHICVCSSRVMELFTDNFDYQTMSDFMRGVIFNEEIEGNKMQIFVVTNEYATRVSNLTMYDTVSKDIIHRWTYPQVPEYLGKESYSFGRNHVYLAKDITLQRGCTLEEDVVIGTNTSIGSNTTISRSVIGRDCKIGENVVLKNAFIWDNVIIESNCQIDTSILCNGVQLRSGVTVQPGSILSFEVIVGPDVSLPSRTYLSKIPPPKEPEFSEDFEDENVKDNTDSISQQDQVMLGDDGVGYIWKKTEENDNDEEEDELVREIWGMKISDTHIKDEDEVSDESDDESGPPSIVLDDTEIFYNQVLDSLQSSYNAGPINCDNLVLEINSSKFANNVSMKELVQLVTKAIVELPNTHSPTVLTAKEFAAFIIPFIKTLIPLLKNYLKGSESQLDFLGSLQECCITIGSLCVSLPKILNILYDKDVLHEQVIVHWFKKIPANDASPIFQQLRKNVEPFITWLEEAEEETDSEDD